MHQIPFLCYPWSTFSFLSLLFLSLGCFIRPSTRIIPIFDLRLSFFLSLNLWSTPLHYQFSASAAPARSHHHNWVLLRELKEKEGGRGREKGGRSMRITASFAWFVVLHRPSFFFNFLSNRPIDYSRIPAGKLEKGLLWQLQRESPSKKNEERDGETNEGRRRL